MTVTPVIRFLLPACVRACALRGPPPPPPPAMPAAWLILSTWTRSALPALAPPPATALVPISRFFKRTWEAFGRSFARIEVSHLNISMHNLVKLLVQKSELLFINTYSGSTHSYGGTIFGQLS